MGQARDTGETLVSNEEGVRKVWPVRRLPEDQQWDGERIKEIKGSPKNWNIDAGSEEEIEDEDNEENEG